MSALSQRAAAIASDRKMAELMNGSTYNGKPSAMPYIVPKTTSPVTVLAPVMPAGNILLGIDDMTGGEIGFDLEKLLDGRLLVQGASGAGKSWTLRRILERTRGQIQQIIIDPEGEFRNLVDEYGHVLVEAHKLDLAAIGILANRVREHRISVLFDLSDMGRAEQMIAVTAFINGLIQVPREHWHPVVVCIDEAHLFAPHGLQGSEPASVRKASVAAVADLMSRGRKRGLCGIIATQRLARLAKSVVSEVFNFAVGINSLDLDIRRAAETIGWDARRAFDRLPMLSPGEFVLSGPAFSRSPVTIMVGAVDTAHRGARPEMSAPIVVDTDTATGMLDLKSLMAATAADEEVRDDGALPLGARVVRSFVRDASFFQAAKVWDALLPLYPEGAQVTDLARHLSLATDDIATAVAHLMSYGMVEIIGAGDDMAARIEKGMMS